MILFYIVVALQIIDVVSTVILLNREGFREGNKVLKAIMDRIGVVPTLVIVKGAFIAWIAYFQEQIPEGIFVVLIAMYLWVCWNNLKLLKK